MLMENATLQGEVSASGLANFRLRRERAADARFLMRLYSDVRREEMVALGWPKAMCRSFLQDQFRLQSHHYRTHYPDASFDIIELEGAPIGRFYIDEGRADWRIIEISLLSRMRGQGLGSALLRRTVERATVAATSLSLHVAFGNPAIRLYRRMGFQVVDTSSQTHLLMRNEGRK